MAVLNNQQMARRFCFQNRSELTSFYGNSHCFCFDRIN